MLYLSQLLKKKIFYGNTSLVSISDFTVSGDPKSPYITNLLVKKSRKKYLIPADSVTYDQVQNRFTAKKEELDFKESNDTYFYLVEDLLDKQVIDITGKRLVRVNDIILEVNGKLKITGIDIGLSGITRRLGLNFPKRIITIPWSVIEAFDYQTGDVKIKLSESKLNTLHPAELADILEEVGTKEREGIVEILDAEQAASAIEEANEDTQEAIIEHLPTPQLEKVLEKMRTSEIADVIDEVNEHTFKKILKILGNDRAKNVENLLRFPDDSAGGLMHLSFYKEKGDKTIGEVLGHLSKIKVQPEAIVVIDDNDLLLGQVHANELINIDPNLPLNKLVTTSYSVDQYASFSLILRKFAEYNLRVLPVIDENNKVIGVITIDAVLHRIEEEKEHAETL